MQIPRRVGLLVGATSVLSLVATARGESAPNRETKEAAESTVPGAIPPSTEEQLARITHPELRLELLRRVEGDQKARSAMT